MPIYLRYAPVKGWSTDQGHVGWIELDSCSFGGSRISVGVGTGASKSAEAKASLEAVCSRPVDDSSTGMFQASIHGEPATATIDFARSDGTVYMSVELTDAVITSYSVSKGHDNDHPFEAFSINGSKRTATIKNAATMPQGIPWDVGSHP
jgi:type VI protein secretion system component Hcp